MTSCLEGGPEALWDGGDKRAPPTGQSSEDEEGEDGKRTKRGKFDSEDLTLETQFRLRMRNKVQISKAETQAEGSGFILK